MSNTAWGIMMLITLIMNLIVIPGDIRDGEYRSAGLSIALAIISAMAMVYFFMQTMTN